MNNIKAEQFLAEITRWAAARPDLMGLALVGSHARGSARPDSDVDLVLVADVPADYLNHTGWVAQFGIVEQQQVEYYGLVTSLRVWYAGGLEVEFGVTDARWVTVPLDAGTQRVIEDGMRVLFERGNVLSRHQ